MVSSVLSLFSPVSDAQALSALAQQQQTVLALLHPREADELSKQKLLAPLAFLLRGRQDVALAQAPADTFALQVFKAGALASSLELEGSQEERALALAEQIGWSPGGFYSSDGMCQ